MRPCEKIGSGLGLQALMPLVPKLQLSATLLCHPANKMANKIAANKLPHGKASIERAVKRAAMPSAR